jgi:hypothetical protein
MFHEYFCSPEEKARLKAERDQAKRVKQDLLRKKNKSFFEGVLAKLWPEWRQYQHMMIYSTIGRMAVWQTLSVLHFDKIDDNQMVIIGYCICEVGLCMSKHPEILEYIWFYVLCSMLFGSAPE